MNITILILINFKYECAENIFWLKGSVRLQTSSDLENLLKAIEFNGSIHELLFYGKSKSSWFENVTENVTENIAEIVE